MGITRMYNSLKGQNKKAPPASAIIVEDSSTKSIKELQHENAVLQDKIDSLESKVDELLDVLGPDVK